MLCCVVLRVALCCVVLCCVVLCCVVLRVVLCCVVLCCVVLCCVLCYVVLCCAVLRCVVLRCVTICRLTAMWCGTKQGCVVCCVVWRGVQLYGGGRRAGSVEVVAWRSE